MRLNNVYDLHKRKEPGAAGREWRVRGLMCGVVIKGAPKYGVMAISSPGSRVVLWFSAESNCPDI